MNTYEVHAFTVSLYATLTVHVKIKNENGEYIDEKFIKTKYDRNSPIEEQVNDAVNSIDNQSQQSGT